MQKQFIVTFAVGTNLMGRRNIDVAVRAPNPVAAVPAARVWLSELYGKVAARSATPREVHAS